MEKRLIMLFILLILVGGCVKESVPAVSEQELEKGWYYGFEDQKKAGTPDDWVWEEAGRSSCWHSPDIEYCGQHISQCSGKGEFCGGIAGIICCEGLTCKLDGSYPDAGGICV